MADKKKYTITTYGCQMNAHDSERLAAILEQNGFESTEKKDEADIIVVNTCCIRESAEKKILGNIGALKQYKDAKPSLKIVVTGCMTQQKGEGEKLLRRFRFVDAVLGTHNMPEFESVLHGLFADEKRILNIYETDGDVFEGPEAARNTFPLSFVNIMYGCNNYCSYCIVPYVRGRERSRRPEAVIDEIASLAEKGYKEVTLLGQNVNSYGKDLEDPLTFSALLKRIDAETNMPRVRFMTSHPKDLSEELINAFMELKSLCSHIHLPVQSGSDRILKLMNRHYTIEHYKQLIGELREKRPGIAVTTDIIVGFPSETEEDFERTLDLVREVRFDSAYTFIFSKRSGTKAAEMEGQLPREVKSERIERLIALQNSITAEINAEMVGKTEQVLVESVSARDVSHIAGRTSSAKMVNFKGGESMIGQFVNARITESKRNSLFGELIAE
jgi:tRNA-2-methylthio-N6-dimethylallyladenosine synthase